MQIDKKKLIALTLIIVSLIFCLVVLMISKKNNIKADYYYNFTYDDNKISQSVKIYNKEYELKLLMDSVKSSKFITKKKSYKPIIILSIMMNL